MGFSSWKSALLTLRNVLVTAADNQGPALKERKMEVKEWLPRISTKLKTWANPFFLFCYPSWHLLGLDCIVFVMLRL